MKAWIYLILFFLCAGQISGQSLMKINVKAKKMAYDNLRNLLYATVKAQDATYGNKLVAIDVITGNIVNSLFLGNEPGAMALTSDHSFLYVGFDSLNSVKKINLAQFSVDSQINLGASPYSAKYFAYDLATIPGHNDFVIVSRTDNSTISTGIVLYKNQQLLPNSSSAGSSFPIEYDALSHHLFGIDNQTSSGALSDYIVDTLQGITWQSTQTIYLGMDIKSRKNLLFSNERKVIDLSANPPYQAGAFSYTGSVGAWGGIDFAVDDSATTCYISTVDNAGIHVAAFDVATFVKKNEALYDNLFSSSSYDIMQMEYIGDESYAMSVRDYYNTYLDSNYVLLKRREYAGIPSLKAGSAAVSVYPDPSAGNFNVVLQGINPAASPVTLSIFNSLGQEVLRKISVQEAIVALDLHACNSGVYLIVAEKNDTHEKLVKRIVKE